MNVKIIRVLNTNAVVSVDSQGMELIMTGPGIGFKKRKGENIDQSLVDKTYHLENKEESKRLQEVVKEISEEYLGIADRVVKEAKKEKLEIRDSLYVTLTDHINFAIQRQAQGIQLKNALLWEIKKFYHQEYLMGKYAINDTATEVRHLRNLGVSVLGVFAGEEKDLSTEKKIFGKDFAYIRDISNFSRIVGRYLIKQLDSDE